ARQAFADLDAGNVGGDGPKFAADLGGGVRLEVPHVLRRRPAKQIEDDDVLGPAAMLGRTALLGRQKLRQAEAAQRSERAGLERLAARHAVAQSFLAAEDGPHDIPPCMEPQSYDKP